MSKFNDILTSVNRTAHKVGLKVKKHSPEILVVVGVVGVAKLLPRLLMSSRNTKKKWMIFVL